MKGIILSGGRGSRLYPLTLGVSKQLMPVYKQPMIYYPLKTLIDMGIDDILMIVSSSKQLEIFKEYLNDGKDYGVNIQYIIQEEPKGLPEAFTLGEKFIGDDDVTLILGDNVLLLNNIIDPSTNTIFTYKVKNPSAYGVVKTDQDGKLDQIIEKPKEFISDKAVVGLYVFTKTAIEIAKTLKPSNRKELEIVDLIWELNKREGVKVSELDGFWFDCGTHDDLLECAEFVRALDKRSNCDILLKKYE
ncbi:MAG: sugar phosphate nucleotidyltransferase [Methanobacterium sp.]